MPLCGGSRDLLWFLLQPKVAQVFGVEFSHIGIKQIIKELLLYGKDKEYAYGNEEKEENNTTRSRTTKEENHIISMNTMTNSNNNIMTNSNTNSNTNNNSNSNSNSTGLTCARGQAAGA